MGAQYEATPDDVVCEHGTAMDVHCCGCHSGFLFDVQSCTCLCSEEEEVAETETSIPPIRHQHLPAFRAVP
jgi:hypothetical protein